jgi:hypothetical protein
MLGFQTRKDGQNKGTYSVGYGRMPAAYKYATNFRFASSPCRGIPGTKHNQKHTENDGPFIHL